MVGVAIAFICAICGKDIGIEGGFSVREWVGENESFELCSPGCLTELAWKFREKQDKLSKSKAVLPGLGVQV